MSCVHKKMPYGLKELIGSFTCTTYMNATKKKVNRKSFQKSLSKNKIHTDVCLLQIWKWAKKKLNDEVLYIEVFPHAHSTCKSAKRELFTFLMILMSEEVAMILSQKQFFRPRASTQVIHTLQVFLRNSHIRKGSYFLSLLMFVGTFCLKILSSPLNIKY